MARSGRWDEGGSRPAWSASTGSTGRGACAGKERKRTWPRSSAPTRGKERSARRVESAAGLASGKRLLAAFLLVGTLGGAHSRLLPATAQIISGGKQQVDQRRRGKAGPDGIGMQPSISRVDVAEPDRHQPDGQDDQRR